MTISSEIQAVLDRYFPPAPAPVDAATTTRSAETDALLRLAGLDPDHPGPAEHEVGQAIAAAQSSGATPEMLRPTAQAYVRGLGRIVAAESVNIGTLVRAQRPEDRADFLDQFLALNLPHLRDVFRALHSFMLREALEDQLSERSLAEPDVAERVISLVDICSSTPYLAVAGRSETQALVDALYEAGQAASRRGAVWPVKYVGDGVFLVGRDAQAVAEASMHAVAVLEQELPLRSRAGVAAGPVVRRAGDYFGSAVSLAQRLTTVATPGTVVVAEPAAAALDDSLVRERDRVNVRGFEQAITIAVVEARRSA